MLLFDLGGVIYPIRILLDDKGAEEVEDIHADGGKNNTQSFGGRRQSYAEVAAYDGSKKKYNTVWRSRGTFSNNTSKISRVADSLGTGHTDFMGSEKEAQKNVSTAEEGARSPRFTAPID